MGLLILDHRDGQNPDGSKGTLCEWDTTPCCHCKGIILVDTTGGVRKYDTPHRCFRCGNRPVCRVCGQLFPDQCRPYAAKIDEAVKTGRWNELAEYHYQRATRT